MNAILQLIVETFLHPRQIAEGIIAERLDRGTLWAAFFFAVICVSIVQFAAAQFAPPQVVTPETEALVVTMNNMVATPFMTTLTTGVLILVAVLSIYFGGQMIGGTGNFLDSLALIGWLQFVNAATGAVVVILLAASPSLEGVATLVNALIIGGVFYATLHFIDVLHGYNSLWAAFGTLVISVIGLAVGLALILVLIGGTAAQTGAI